jgi:thymidylate kinase
MKKAVLICFVGIDGSGKTTQAKALAKALTSEGFDCRYVWNSYVPGLIRPFIAIGKLAFFRGKDALKHYGQYSETRDRLFSSSLTAALYRGLLLLDYSLQVMPRIRLKLALGKNLICDRYIYDTVADMTVELGYSAEKRKRLMKGFFRFFPRPDLVFLIDAPEAIAAQRKKEHPVELLRERRRVYLDMARECGMIVMDGSRGETELQGLIRNEIRQLDSLKD